MKSVVRRKLEMAVRVREYFRANPPAEARHLTLVKRFEELLGAAEGLMDRQRDGRLVAGATLGRRHELRREVVDRCLRHVVSVARQASKAYPDRFGDFRLPSGSAGQLAFASQVRSMLTAAKAEREVLTEHGLAEKVLDDLERLLGEYEKQQSSSIDARRTSVGATADLDRLGLEITAVVRVLDGINRYRLADLPESLAQWQHAKSVAAVPVRNKVLPEGKAA